MKGVVGRLMMGKIGFHLIRKCVWGVWCVCVCGVCVCVWAGGWLAGIWWEKLVLI